MSRAFWVIHAAGPEIEHRLKPHQVDIQSRLSVAHGTVFPNLGFLENFKTGTDGEGSACRYIRLTLKVPIAPDVTEMYWWHLVPTDSGAAWRRESQRSYVRTNGAAGMFEVDDGENFVGIAEAHRGSTALNGSFDLLGGITDPIESDGDWPGRVVHGDRSEHTARAWLRRWDELMDKGDPVALPRVSRRQQTRAVVAGG